MKQFVATRAFIVNDDGNVLVIRESTAYEGGSQIGKYDFPGGKIKPGETHVQATKREVAEETGLDVELDRPFFVSEWYPEVNDEQLHIVGIFFQCRPNTMEVTLSDDHDDYEWIDPGRYTQWSLMQENIGAFEAYNNAIT